MRKINYGVRYQIYMDNLMRREMRFKKKIALVEGCRGRHVEVKGREG